MPMAAIFLGAHLEDSCKLGELRGPAVGFSGYEPHQIGRGAGVRVQGGSADGRLVARRATVRALPDDGRANRLA